MTLNNHAKTNSASSKQPHSTTTAMTVRTILIIAIGLCLIIPTAAQSVLERYLEFSVLSSTREDVMKLYGEGKIGNNPYFVTYYRDGLRVSVEYAIGDCRSSIPIWNVPAWTVTEITYSFLNEKPELRDLLAKNDFKSRQAGDVRNHLEYYNNEKGVTILYDKAGEGVMDIIIRPSHKATRKFRCQ